MGETRFDGLARGAGSAHSGSISDCIGEGGDCRREGSIDNACAPDHVCREEGSRDGCRPDGKRIDPSGCVDIWPGTAARSVSGKRPEVIAAQMATRRGDDRREDMFPLEAWLLLTVQPGYLEEDDRGNATGCICCRLGHRAAGSCHGWCWRRPDPRRTERARGDRARREERLALVHKMSRVVRRQGVRFSRGSASRGAPTNRARGTSTSSCPISRPRLISTNAGFCARSAAACSQLTQGIPATAPKAAGTRSPVRRMRCGRERQRHPRSWRLAGTSASSAAG